MGEARVGDRPPAGAGKDRGMQTGMNTNLITIDATDPKSGTAEFKAAAVRIERLDARVPVAGE